MPTHDIATLIVGLVWIGSIVFAALTISVLYKMGLINDCPKRFKVEEKEEDYE
jgi:hypothetical protein